MVQAEAYSPPDEFFEAELGGYLPHKDYEGGPIPDDVEGIGYIFAADHDLFTLAKQVKPEFVDAFQKARESYVEGDWINAQTCI